ncbi:acyl-CoA--sterol O-acyltransferase 1-like [Quillaja saponaria]|uniref:Acyl-CoA--sterol O-acyltransferase 1-like n=1 Tax=Quillaja saponaria TaxID=32244 RepID=A0AAD7LT80_QUISA|nr:acyl-CoA--sterol O-acyltransferase 1-like [Quillaja saponaria]
MDGEIQSFIKIWITAITCLCYCYHIVSRIPKGFFRLLFLLPIFYLFTILPLTLSSIHLIGVTFFFLVWLANFKLLLFSFDHGPLSSPFPSNTIHFIFIASLPINIKQTPPDEKPVKPNASRLSKLILLGIKVILIAMILRAYDYRDKLHPYLILALYLCHIYLDVEIVLAICAAPARAIFGFELEPQFNEPYLSTSLQDFWGRRWNVMVTTILRPTVYNPIRQIARRFVGTRWSKLPAVIATFTVSGLMHEMLYYYPTRAPPTGEVLWFFILHGVSVAVEVEVKKALLPRGWRLHRAVSGPLALLFLAVTGNWLFLPQLLRNGVDMKAINEYAIMKEFVKANLCNCMSMLGLKIGA